FSGAALMSRNNVAKAENRLHGIAEAREAGRARIGLVAAHHGGPLLRGHGRRAGIREQVNQDCFRSDQKKIVPGLFDELLPFRACSPANGLNTLYAEWFDDRANRHGVSRLSLQTLP